MDNQPRFPEGGKHAQTEIKEINQEEILRKNEKKEEATIYCILTRDMIFRSYPERPLLHNAPFCPIYLKTWFLVPGL